MSKFTPGPWEWRSNPCGGDALFGADDMRVHTDGSACYEYAPDIDVDGPDAALIAAAPDMYEALNFFLARHIEMVNSGDCGSWDPETDPEVKQARAALAKADGIPKPKPWQHTSMRAALIAAGPTRGHVGNMNMNGRTS